MAAMSMPQYPRWYKRPYEDPARALYQAYNLEGPLTTLNGVTPDKIPSVIDMHAVQAHDMPTHALIILDASQDQQYEPMIVPIDLAAFSATFQNVDKLQKPLARQPTTTHQLGVPYVDTTSGDWKITLPTLILEAPHPPTIPLLLLYTLWDFLPTKPPAELTPPPSPDSFKSTSTSLHTPPPTPATTASFGSQSSIANPRTPTPTPEPARPLVCVAQLAAHLLPTAVLGEFPAYPAQAAALARAHSDDELRALYASNGGLWRNVLLLAPRAHAIQDITSNAWNTVAAAYKHRAEYRADRSRARRREEAAERKRKGKEREEALAQDARQAGQPADAAPATQAAGTSSGGREAAGSGPDTSPPGVVQDSHPRRNV